MPLNTDEIIKLLGDNIKSIGTVVTVGGLLIKFRKWVGKTFFKIKNYLTLKIGNSKQLKIQSSVNDFTNSAKGKNYLNHHKDKGLLQKVENSFKLLNKKTSSHEIAEDTYYIYLFSLLQSASTKIWAVSINNPLEWEDTDAETMFLNLNLEASKRKVYVTRIFLIDKVDVKNFLKKRPILSQIKESVKSKYYFTQYVYKEDVTIHLTQQIASGFLAFDELVIARDVFADDIRGILDTESYNFYNNMFNSLYAMSKPLDDKFYKEITGKNL